MKSILIAVLLFVAASPAFSFQKDYSKGDFKKAAEHVFKKVDSGQEKAASWNLDYNTFAAKIQGALFIFDYINDRPVNKYGSDMERSLFTGVIEPAEIADQKVVVFYSHEHPAEKTFLKALEWRKQIKNIHYVVSAGVYEKFSDKIEELRQEDKKERAMGDVYEDLSTMIKVAKPGTVVAAGGVNVKVVGHDYLLDPDKNIPYPGVEFIIETPDGITMYHSGAFTCVHCMKDIPSVKNKGSSFNSSSTINSSTKSMVFQDGKLVSMDGKGVDGSGTVTDERKDRIAFVMLSGMVPQDMMLLIDTTFLSNSEENGFPARFLGRLDTSAGEISPFDRKILEDNNTAIWQDGARSYAMLRGNRQIVVNVTALAASALRYFEMQPVGKSASTCRANSYCVIEADSSDLRLRSSFRYLSNKEHFYITWGYVDHYGFPCGFDPREGVYKY